MSGVVSAKLRTSGKGCVLSGSLEFTLGEEKRKVTVRAGEVLHLPSNLPHGARAVEETTVLDIFAPPSTGTGIDRKG